VDRIFGLSAQARRWPRPGILVLLVLLLIQAQCSQSTANVLYAVIPSWDDPDTDDGDSITPLSTADVGKVHGHIALHRPIRHGSRRSSDNLCRDQSPTFSDVIARAPPVASFHTSSLYVRSSCWLQFDLDPNGHASARVPPAFTIVHAINPRLELIRWQVLRRAGSEAVVPPLDTKGADAVTAVTVPLPRPPNISLPDVIIVGGLVANTAIGFQALQSNTSGVNNTASGFFALRDNTTGNANTAIGEHALFQNITGSQNTAIGFDAFVSTGDLTNATAIGAGAVVDANSKIRLGNTLVTVIEGQVDFTFTSDMTKKENFQPVDGEEVLRKLRGLTLTSWNYIGHDPKQFRHYGPMGQEFFAAFGHDAIGTIGSPTTLTASDLAGVLMSAVQAIEKRTVQLREEEDRLQKTVETFKAENAELRARLERLERTTTGYAR
jgi:Chaperone of endosialidase